VLGAQTTAEQASASLKPLQARKGISTLKPVAVLASGTIPPVTCWPCSSSPGCFIRSSLPLPMRSKHKNNVIKRSLPSNRPALTGQSKKDFAPAAGAF